MLPCIINLLDSNTCTKCLPLTISSTRFSQDGMPSRNINKQPCTWSWTVYIWILNIFIILTVRVIKSHGLYVIITNKIKICPHQFLRFSASYLLLCAIIVCRIQREMGWGSRPPIEKFIFIVKINLGPKPPIANPCKHYNNSDPIPPHFMENPCKCIVFVICYNA